MTDQSNLVNLQELLSTLTPRESEVYRHVATGSCNKIIARELGISDGVVKIHVRHILEKTGADNRTHAAVMYVRAELLKQEDAA